MLAGEDAVDRLGMAAITMSARIGQKSG